MKFKCAGAVSGAVTVSDDAKVEDLVRELERLAGCSKGGLKVIAGGKRFTEADDAKPLSDAGITEKTRLVVSRTGPSPAVEAAAQRIERLDRISAAADAIARRGETGISSRRAFVIETQDNVALQGVPEEDRRALVAGLALHQKGKRLLDDGKVVDALDILQLSEEAFTVASDDITCRVDNIGLLMLDIVWALFLQQDISKLAAAAGRLRRARESFATAHGPNLERLRTLQGGFSPELGIYVRLELLEGIAAFHAGNTAAARTKLLSAREKHQKLRLDDDTVAEVVAMGFSAKEARRGLRFCGGNVSAAATFVLNRRRHMAEAAAAAAEHERANREQRRFGKTLRGARVDLSALASMEALGFERRTAAEALRQCENNAQAALDALADSARRAEIEAAATEAASRSRSGLGRRRNKRPRGHIGGDGNARAGDVVPQSAGAAGKAAGTAAGADPAAVASLIDIGFSPEAAAHALEAAGGNADTAAALLLSDDSFGGGNANDGAGNLSNGNLTANGSHANGAGEEEGGDGEGGDNDDDDDDDSGDDEDREDADEEMEADLAEGADGDTLKEYDVDLTQEGAALEKYLGLLGEQDLAAVP